jgi:Protein of unknown function (DUF3105)
VALAAVAAFGLLFAPTPPRPIPAAAMAAARAGGCGGIETPASSAPGGLHLSPGEAYRYPAEPATSGYHDPNPLPSEPHVLTTPVSDVPGSGDVPETRAVHNLEHAFVMVYYRASGPSALPLSVVSRLAPLVRSQDRVLMAPHAQLPTGTALALAAWNTLWTCPPTIDADQAVAVATGFIAAYRGTSNAPEAPLHLRV